METIQNVNDFKKFMDANRDKINKRVIKAEDIPIDDEWMQDDNWDEIYQQEKK